ncbi:MAG: DNA translocase FtsK 4TM domain-containing protein [Acidobacteriota bacterium]
MKPIRIVLSPTRSRPVNIFLGMLLLLVAVLLLLALVTYHASDPSLNTSTDAVGPHAARNWAGLFGAYLSDLLLQTFGITAFFLPLCMGGIGWNWVRSRPGGPALLRWTGILLTLLFVPTAFGLLPWHWRWLHMVAIEGVIGRLTAGLLVTYLNIQGAWVVTAALAVVGVYFALAISFETVKEWLEERWIHWMAWRDRWRNWREERAEMRAARKENAKASEELFEEQEPPLVSGIDVGRDEERRGWLSALFGRKKTARVIDPVDDIPAFRRAGPQGTPEPGPAAAGRVPEPIEEQEIPITPPSRKAAFWEPEQGTAPTAPAKITPIRPQATPAAASIPDPWAASPKSVPAPAAEAAETIAIHERADAEVRTATVAPKSVSGFKLPPSTLLNAGEGPQTVREEALREEAKVLVEKCGEFDVRGQVVQINPGPMVTTYEFKPEAGVKYSRVTGLADDLCLAMRAESILIERMPGKSTVGIQVPNHERETIHLRDVIESETFAKAKSRLTLAMGKDINGRIVTADLATMPHVLIAGSTGSGKSVAINAMIMSLLYRTTPAQVRLILVDPKRVELGMYEGIPHLFTPIITEPKAAANALRNAVREMERRLKLLASRSVRNIDQYNKLFEGSSPSLFGPEDGQVDEPLPYIVIIIDELADLMMLDRANVEESITRLAQMARAVGIHLVLATQRPSVDVITGLIKANVPTRISFRLATKVDSRTILDTNGAEALLGRGDMLFLPPGTSRLMRLHAPYVSEKETAAVVQFWKEQGTAEYVEGFLESPKDEHGNVEGSSSDSDDNDPMFDDAVRLVFEFGKASTSLLQRRLRIGYGRAAHLIDMMERDGLVGPADGSRPRELLKAPGWLHEIAASNE